MNHPLTAIYVARYQDGLAAYCRFMDSLQRTADGNFGLRIVYKGFPDMETAYEGWHPHHRHDFTTASMLPDANFDLGAYRHAAERLEAPVVACFNSSTEILDPHWNRHYLAALNQPGVGLVGATGSWESFNKSWWHNLFFPPWPNPHVRTNAFAMRRDVLLKVWPRRFRSKYGCYLFESGHGSLSRKVWRLGLRLVVVNSAGEVLDWWRWRSLGAYRNGGRELVARDRRSRQYDDEPAPEVRRKLYQLTWGA